MAPLNCSEEEISMLLEKVRSSRGWDFRSYKRTSLRRRLAKRLGELGIDSLGDYSARLDSDPEEYDRLFSTLTIQVSEFFREPRAFELLGSVLRDYVPERRRAGAKEVRAWCCGCAGGEEAYSLAMLLADVTGRVDKDMGFKVFATDIDPGAVEKARKAVYREDSTLNVPPAFREGYMFPVEGAWKVKYDIRNLVKFGTLDIVRDTPISKIDVLVCRNLFIYFDKGLQDKVFDKLDYSLRPGGVMVLGKAEVLPPRFSRSYHSLGGRFNIYRKSH